MHYIELGRQLQLRRADVPPLHLRGVWLPTRGGQPRMGVLRSLLGAGASDDPEGSTGTPSA